MLYYLSFNAQARVAGAALYEFAASASTVPRSFWPRATPTAFLMSAGFWCGGWRLWLEALVVHPSAHIRAPARRPDHNPAWLWWVGGPGPSPSCVGNRRWRRSQRAPASHMNIDTDQLNQGVFAILFFVGGVGDPMFAWVIQCSSIILYPTRFRKSGEFG